LTAAPEADWLTRPDLSEERELNDILRHELDAQRRS